MKKVISLVLALALAAAIATPSLARGHHGSARTVSYAVCAVEDCIGTGVHLHNGAYYAAHHYADGHDYHGYCEVQSCALTGYHEHDGEYCFGRALSDGRGYNQRGCCRN